MATVKKIDRDHYLVRYDDYSTGKRVQRSKTFPRQTEARAFVRALENGRVANMAAESRTLGEWLDTWLASKLPAVAPNTQKSYLTHVRSLKRLPIARAPLAKLLPAHIERDLHALTVSPATRKVTKTILSGALRAAVDNGILPHNPCDRVRMNTPVREKRRIPNAQEAVSFIDAITDRTARLACRIALFGGLRLSEVMGLKWEDVDFAGGILTVSRTRTETVGKVTSSPDSTWHTETVNGTRYLVKPPKNGKTRAFQMPDNLIRALLSAKDEQRQNALRLGAKYIRTDYVVTRASGAPARRQTIEAAINPLCRFHDLRHLHITMMINAGVPVTEVSRRVGHSNISITLNVYSHSDTSLDASAADTLDTLIARCVSDV